MGRTPPGRSRVGWIAAVALLALLAALAATCEPAAEVRGPGDGGRTDALDAAGSRRTPRPRTRRDGGLPEGADPPGTAGTTREAPPGPDPAAPREAPPSGALTVRRTCGRVVDSSNDAPVVGARVLLALFAEKRAVPSGNWGSVTDAEGRFDVGPRTDESCTADRVEVIVVSPAHHVGRAPAEDGVVVRLEPRRTAEPLGAISGTILDEKGTPVGGVRQLEGNDLTGDWRGVWTLAGADGSFRVEGVAPGPWSIGAGEGQPRVECLVPPGGEARVTLTVRGEERPYANLTDEELQARLRSGTPVPDGVLESGTDAQREFALRIQLERQSLRWEELVRRPVRPVVVEGLADDATIVRARRPGTSQWWSARPASGRAEFPALFTTAWDLEVERPGVPVAVRRIDVPEGKEPLVLRWAPAE